MKDKEYLDQYIECISQSHGKLLVTICDIDLVHRYVSEPLLKAVNLTVADTSGQNLRNLNVPIARAADDIKQASLKVIQKRVTANYKAALTIIDDAVMLYSNYVIPIINPETDNVVGNCTICTKLVPQLVLGSYFKVLEKVHKTKRMAAPNIPTSMPKLALKLTKREHEIAFLLSLGWSHKEIADILSDIYNKPILPNAISGVITKQIYPKFNVFSVSAIIEVFTKYNLWEGIPAALVNQFTGVFSIEYFD